MCQSAPENLPVDYVEVSHKYDKFLAGYLCSKSLRIQGIVESMELSIPVVTLIEGAQRPQIRF